MTLETIVVLVGIVVVLLVVAATGAEVVEDTSCLAPNTLLVTRAPTDDFR